MGVKCGGVATSDIAEMSNYRYSVSFDACLPEFSWYECLDIHLGVSAVVLQHTAFSKCLVFDIPMVFVYCLNITLAFLKVSQLELYNFRLSPELALDSAASVAATMLMTVKEIAFPLDALQTLAVFVQKLLGLSADIVPQRYPLNEGCLSHGCTSDVGCVRAKTFRIKCQHNATAV